MRGAAAAWDLDGSGLGGSRLLLWGQQVAKAVMSSAPYDAIGAQVRHTGVPQQPQMRVKLLPQENANQEPAGVVAEQGNTVVDELGKMVLTDSLDLNRQVLFAPGYAPAPIANVAVGPQQCAYLCKKSRLGSTQKGLGGGQQLHSEIVEREGNELLRCNALYAYSCVSFKVTAPPGSPDEVHNGTCWNSELDHATLTARLEAVENRLSLLESQADVTPVHTSKARLIQELLATNPEITVPEVQGRTGIKADTIRKIMLRQKRSEKEEEG